MRSPTRWTRSRCGTAGSSRTSAAVSSPAVRLVDEVVDHRGHGGEGRLVLRRGECDERLLDGPFAEYDDEAGHPLVDRDEVDASDARGGGLGRRREARGVGQRSDRRRGEPEPVFARVFDLAELVADHQLLDAGHGRGVDDRLDVPAIAGVGGDAPSRRVRMIEEAGELQLGEDVAHGRAGHAKPVPVDERLASDRRCGGHVFLDDGPKDRL